MGLIYTGIGSRETPEKVQQFMAEIGQALGAAGWTLRSGFADGADNAFARRAKYAERQRDRSAEILDWMQSTGGSYSEYEKGHIPWLS